jgi:hypothetical protein
LDVAKRRARDGSDAIEEQRQQNKTKQQQNNEAIWKTREKQKAKRGK